MHEWVSHPLVKDQPLWLGPERGFDVQCRAAQIDAAAPFAQTPLDELQQHALIERVRLVVTPLKPNEIRFDFPTIAHAAMEPNDVAIQGGHPELKPFAHLFFQQGKLTAKRCEANRIKPRSYI